MVFFSWFHDHPFRRWVLWAILLTVWTGLLLIPVPQEVHWPVTITHGRKFILAKCLHFFTYAFLAALTGWLQPRFRWRLLLLFILMVHAPVTELAQLELAKFGISNRSGTVEDVVLDHGGIAVGLLLSWKWWATSEPDQSA